MQPAASSSPGTADYAALIAAQLAVGSAAILAKYGLESGLSASSLSAWRLSLASVVLIAGLYIAQRRSRPLPALGSATRARMVVAGLFLGIHFVLWFASLERISVARSTLLVTSGPVWTALGGWLFLRQRVCGRFWAGLAVAGLGAYFVTGGGVEAGDSALEGDLLAIGGAIAVAAYLLLTQDLQTSVGTGRTVAWTYASSAIALWPWILIGGTGSRSLLPTGLAGWGSVLGMALLPQLVGHTLLNWSLKRFTAGTVAAATLLEPVFAAALAWILFGEAITLTQGLGAGVLLGGVGLAISRPPAERNAFLEDQGSD